MAATFTILVAREILFLKQQRRRRMRNAKRKHTTATMILPVAPAAVPATALVGVISRYTPKPISAPIAIKIRM